MKFALPCKGLPLWQRLLLAVLFALGACWFALFIGPFLLVCALVSVCALAFYDFVDTFFVKPMDFLFYNVIGFPRP